MPKMTISDYAHKYLPLPVRIRYLYNCANSSSVEINKEYTAELDVFGKGAFVRSVTPECDQYWIDVGNLYKKVINDY